MEDHRLAKLHLLPPPQTGAWDSLSARSAESLLSRPDGRTIRLDAPLFWYRPSWIRLETTVASVLAAAVARQDVVVSALHRDLNEEGGQSELFEALSEEGGDSVTPETPPFLPRMTPYRAERFGLTDADFDHTSVVDVRLSPTRDHSGRFAFSPEQMDRWEQPAEGVSLAGGGYVAAATFPGDVVSLKQMSVKLDQLRMLAPSAGVFVSLSGIRTDQDLRSALQAEPDGVIIRLDEVEFDGLQLAAYVYRARKILIDVGVPDLPLWVVPGAVSPDDVAKLIALGASAVALDAWCEPLIDRLEGTSGVDLGRDEIEGIHAMVSGQLWDDIDRVIGLVSTIPGNSTPEQALGTFHSKWASACGVAQL